MFYSRLMKVVCLLVPHLSVQVERRRDPGLKGAPLVVGGRPWDPGAVLDCCPTAEAAGIRPGMRLSRAEGLCPGACFLPADELSYRAAHRTLETALRRLTDRVETAGLGFFLADVTGLERALGSAAALCRRLATESGEATGLRVRVGLAGNRFAAERAAQTARPGRWYAVPAGQEKAFLSSLPLTTLPADAEVVRRLHQLGLRTLGALAVLPRLALVRQFGSQAGFLHDLASGCDPRPVHADALPLVLEGAHAFEPPVAGRAPLLVRVRQIVGTLAAEIARRGYRAEGLRVRLEDEGGEVHTAAAPVQPPTADPDRLARRAVGLLEGLAPSRPVVDLAAEVYPLRPAYLGATQMALFAAPADARHGRLQEVLRRLRERFGEMVIVVASLLSPPLPRPIQVTTDPSGLPRALVWPDRILSVARVYEHWRERRFWWTRPLLRDYYRTETADGQVRVVFRDRGSGRWWLERRYL